MYIMIIFVADNSKKVLSICTINTVCFISIWTNKRDVPVIFGQQTKQRFIFNAVIMLYNAHPICVTLGVGMLLSP